MDKKAVTEIYYSERKEERERERERERWRENTKQEEA